jgi:hypothetical protein
MYGIPSEQVVDDSVPFVTLPTRTRLLQRLEENRNFDLLILGGGLMGALLAHEAALGGIKVLLLERGYFGQGALNWDVRIARQMRKGPLELLRARNSLKIITKQRAPHLISALPLDTHKLSQGALSRISAAAVKRLVQLNQVNERLLIRESVLAARQEGASVLSGVIPYYVEAESAESGCYVVGFQDSVSGKHYKSRVGGIVIDPTHGVLPPSRLGSYVVPSTDPVSAGVQLTYQAAPRSAKTAMSFVSFELTDGSFVAVQRTSITTIQVTLLWGAKELTAEQSNSVISDALGEAGWTAEREVQRREVAGRWGSRYGIKQVKGVFTCYHRGPWDAFKSSQTIVRALLALTHEPKPRRAQIDRLLPGAERNCEADAFRALARAQGISEQTIERAVDRWRGRVRYIPQFANGMHECVPGVLRGEIELAVVSDHVGSLEDLVFGALDLHQASNWRDSIPTLEERLQAFLSE